MSYLVTDKGSQWSDSGPIKIPSEIQLAPRYTLLTLFKLFNTIYTVYTIQTALHCLNSSMYAYIVGNVTPLLEWDVGLQSKMLDGWRMDTP